MGIPVVMLTGRGDEMDKIIGLEPGGRLHDEALQSPRELIARLRAVLRRVGHPACNRPTAAPARSVPSADCGWTRPPRELLDRDGSEIP